MLCWLGHALFLVSIRADESFDLVTAADDYAILMRELSIVALHSACISNMRTVPHVNICNSNTHYPLQLYRVFSSIPWHVLVRINLKYVCCMVEDSWHVPFFNPTVDGSAYLDSLGRYETSSRNY